MSICSDHVRPSYSRIRNTPPDRQAIGLILQSACLCSDRSTACCSTSKTVPCTCATTNRTQVHRHRRERGMWPLWKKSEDAPEPKSASPTLASTPAGEDLTVPSHRERSITSGEDRRPYAAPIVDHSAGGTIATSSTASSSDTPAEHGAHSSPPQGSAGPSLAIIPTTAFLLGFAAGAYNNASRAGLIFMAENAHRRPDTVQGWFFYNKTKVSQRRCTHSNPCDAIHHAGGPGPGRGPSRSCV